MPKTLLLNNCLDCPHHKKIPSLLTGDSFDAADEDVICTHPDSNDRVVSASNRWPKQMRAESKIPNWCPLP